jgi:pimeloyl-ACP methyl ester carboxylesterase
MDELVTVVLWAAIAVSAFGVVMVAIGVAGARALVAPGRRLLTRFRVIEQGTVDLEKTKLTRLPGMFGLTYDSGHARVSSIIAEPNAIRRTTEAVIGGAIPSSGSGWWRRDVYRTPDEAGMAYDEVAIATEFGDAAAWVVPPPTGDNSGMWAVHLHGIRTTRSVVIPSVIAASRAGMTSLVPSWRNDGEGPSSRGGHSTLGATEWLDVDAAVDYAVEAGARSVVLVGWSLGAAIALLIATRSAHASRVAGLVLIAPVTNWRSVLALAIRNAHLPGLFTSLVGSILRNRTLCRLAGLRMPVDLRQLAPSPQQLDIPALVIHNPGDQLVPFSATEEFAAAYRGQIELARFAPCPHAMEWNTERERFDTTLHQWLIGLRLAAHSRTSTPIPRNGGDPIT